MWPLRPPEDFLCNGSIAGLDNDILRWSSSNRNSSQDGIYTSPQLPIGPVGAMTDPVPMEPPISQ